MDAGVPGTVISTNRFFLEQGNDNSAEAAKREGVVIIPPVYIDPTAVVERSVIGDIAVLDDSTAVLFAKTGMAEYLMTSLERIGSAKVRITPLTDEEAMQTPDTRRWETFSDTVASLRLDGVVAAAANLSRDKAKQTVTAGFVDVDFRPCTAPDTELVPGTYLSIRGFGRYLLSDVDGLSKKGRIRIRIKKLV